MANVTTELKVLVKAVGKGELKELENALNKLAVTARTKVDVNFKKVSAELKKIQSTSTTSIKNLRDYRNAWRDIAAQLDISSKEFREATAEAAKLDAQLAKAEKRKPAGGGRFASAAKGVGAIAGAGVFGGPEGAVGAAIGLGIGGPGPAIVGGAIGAQVGQLRKAIGGVAEYGAELSKLRIALRGVSSTQLDYENSLRLIQQATQDFAIPQSILTKQFTRLQASVQGAGGSVQDTKTAFNGVVAAVRATGGSLQDVDSALTATAQVFSKGKVSAEELRQQIGERLPGAFTLFAESIGKTPQELDKALEQGKVSLQDFLTFSESLFEKFGETAQIIADGPEGAGDRLVVATEKLNEQMAPELANLGAQFQGFAKEAIDALSSVFTFLGEIGQAIEQKINGKLIENQRKALEAAKQTLVRTDLTSLQEDFARDQIKRLQPIIDAFDFIGPQPTAPSRLSGGGGGGNGGGNGGGGGSERKSLAKIKDASAEVLFLTQEMNAARATGQLVTAEQLRLELDIQSITERFNANQITFNEASRLSSNAIEASRIRGLKLRKDEKNELAKLSEKQKEVKKELTETEKMLKSIKDTLATGIASAIEGLIDGTKTLRESFAGILKQIGSLFLQAGIGSFGSGGKAGTGLLGLFGFAKGGVFAENKIVPYAKGGIVNNPTMFAYANGGAGRFGLMGEAGPEAIMPLRRGANGRLGIESSGVGASNVVVNVDASGSSVEGNDEQSQMLGKAIGIAVQQELIKQQRPGGLLR